MGKHWTYDFGRNQNLQPGDYVKRPRLKYGVTVATDDARFVISRVVSQVEDRGSVEIKLRGTKVLWGEGWLEKVEEFDYWVRDVRRKAGVK